MQVSNVAWLDDAAEAFDSVAQVKVICTPTPSLLPPFPPSTLHGHSRHLIMRDPFPIAAPQWLAEATRPLADKLSLPTLPMHIHEVLLAVVFYQSINAVIAPALSRRFFPQAYSSFNQRTRINWDVHIVSMVQSLLVNTTALWIMFYDEERSNMNWAGKIWGYDGALGFLQSLAGGYFMWDLFMCTYHINIFGVGMLAHAISACTVFFFGFVCSSSFSFLHLLLSPAD